MRQTPAVLAMELVRQLVLYLAGPSRWGEGGRRPDEGLPRQEGSVAREVNDNRTIQPAYDYGTLTVT